MISNFSRLSYYSLSVINVLTHSSCNIKKREKKEVKLFSYLDQLLSRKNLTCHGLSISKCASQWSIDLWYDMVLNTAAVTIPGCIVTLFTSWIIPLSSVKQQQHCEQGYCHIWHGMNKTYKRNQSRIYIPNIWKLFKIAGEYYKQRQRILQPNVSYQKQHI